MKIESPSAGSVIGSRDIMFNTPTFELYANNGPLFIRIAIAMICLSATGVGLRFYAKRLVGQSISLDDWLIVLALPASWGVCIGEIYAVKHGNLGRHITLVVDPELPTFDPNVVVIFLKALYASQLAYTLSLFFTKFSLTILYRRLFHVPTSNLWLLIFEWTLGARLIATMVVFIFPCRPIDKFWFTSVPGYCVNIDDMFIVTAVTNIATDIFLVLFPIPIIWSLQIYRSQKISVYMFFLLGGGVILISLIRMVSIIDSFGNPDVTWSLLPLAVWSTTETNVAIFCACIPAMRPLIRFFPGRSPPMAATPNMDHNKHKLHRGWWGGQKEENTARFRKVPESIEESLGIYGPTTLITAHHVELSAIPENDEGIHIQREIVWS